MKSRIEETFCKKSRMSGTICDSAFLTIRCKMMDGVRQTDILPFRIILAELPHGNVDRHHFRPNLQIICSGKCT